MINVKITSALLFIFIFLGSDLAFADTIPFPNWGWACPPRATDTNVPQPSIDKDKDGKVDRKYVHIVDDHGNDIQLWCLDHGPTGDFRYYSSAPNREDIYIAGCWLICGRNFGDILVGENSTITSRGTNPLGTQLFDVNGTLIGYNHTNYVPHDINSVDKGKDYHFFFNSTLHRSYVVVRTVIDNATGEHRVAQAGSQIFPPSASDEERLAFVNDIFFDGADVTPSDVIGEYSEHDERYMVVYSSLDVPTIASIPFTIIHPTQVKFDKMTFDAESKSLFLTLPDGHEKYVNLSIPRELIDHQNNEQFVVMVDETMTDYEENSSDSYRTLTFYTSSDSKQISISEPKKLTETPIIPTTETPEKGGGCLIATATYGSELAPQVQQLRELRDNSLLQTETGTSFMTGFNQFYYSFSPTIADWERENPVFKEFVKITLTPMISSLSILNYVSMDSESEVLGYGISLIMLNLGMYFGAPAIVIIGIKKKFNAH